MDKKKIEIEKYRTFAGYRLFYIILWIIVPYIVIGIVILLSTLSPSLSLVSSNHRWIGEAKPEFQFIAFLLVIITMWFYGIFVIAAGGMILGILVVLLYEAYNYIFPEEKKRFVVCDCGSKSPDDTSYCPSCGEHLEEEE